MNKQKFLEQVEHHKTSLPIDTSRLANWFASIVKTLVELHRQKTGISHPRHRGDAREADFLNVIKDMFPITIPLAKGFLVSPRSSVSREQDIVALNGSLPNSLMGSGDGTYLMAGAALASIEVKSNLTLIELRKAILNCMSAKGVVQGLDEEEVKHNLWHVIFAYDSPWSLQETATRMNKAVETVPDHLRPDGLYLLGSGLVLLGSQDGLDLSYKQTPNNIIEYVTLGPMGTDLLGSSEAYPFLWFIHSIISHCLEERTNRDDVKSFDYFTMPLIFQSNFERQMKEENPELFGEWLARAAKRSSATE